MTATILLVRHAAHVQLGRVLSGRGGDVPLSSSGRTQARQLARHLRCDGLDAIHTSPVRRARETAGALAAAAGVTETIAPPLDEIDFGSWAGRTFSELAADPHWHEWNMRRDRAVPPGGEAMCAVQRRVLGHLRSVAREAAGKVVAMVSHADVIRAAVAGVLGLPLRRILGFDVDPASVTRIAAGAWGERLVCLNERCG